MSSISLQETYLTYLQVEVHKLRHNHRGQRIKSQQLQEATSPSQVNREDLILRIAARAKEGANLAEPKVRQSKNQNSVNYYHPKFQ